ncbi:MAG: N-acetyl-gamma-glutamyl-phosphate reductase [Mogibacterium sp.]|nr:N-acetyl-gamma-glutamyl-phosphate reductase [Mogibacterium sp.]MBQ6502239.1 N-acetyl-gamma-glutamyl-phosphate reductase [Mogibacterium sp.]
MYKVFIDGAHGTTGLRINEYLAGRPDIQIMEIDPEKRKDIEARVHMIKEADVSILCLPDQASREIAAAAPADSVIIDTSTAHRTDPDWTYGMPELTAGHREKIRSSTRIANPGCHASGFILLVRPLIEAGLLDRDDLLTCFCVTGYSGGGKKMIADYEDDDRAAALDSPGQYALGQSHKHLPEMVAMTGLEHAPCFSPVVADFYSGMVMTVPVHGSMLRNGAGIKDVKEALHMRYDAEPLINVNDEAPESGKVYSNPMAGSNGVEMYVTGNEERILLIASYDNLGKGASGAAVQNLNIVLGTEETAGLI